MKMGIREVNTRSAREYKLKIVQGRSDAKPVRWSKCLKDQQNLHSHWTQYASVARRHPSWDIFVCWILRRLRFEWDQNSDISVSISLRIWTHMRVVRFISVGTKIITGHLAWSMDRGICLHVAIVGKSCCSRSEQLMKRSKRKPMHRSKLVMTPRGGKRRPGSETLRRPEKEIKKWKFNQIYKPVWCKQRHSLHVLALLASFDVSRIKNNNIIEWIVMKIVLVIKI